MSGRQSWVRRKAEPQFVRQVDSKSEMEIWSSVVRFVWESVVPALLKRIVGAPRLLVTEAWRERTCAGDVLVAVSHVKAC